MTRKLKDRWDKVLDIGHQILKAGAEYFESQVLYTGTLFLQQYMHGAGVEDMQLTPLRLSNDQDSLLRWSLEIVEEAGCAEIVWFNEKDEGRHCHCCS